jgi:predicted MPP superfamily phosphohydrolase
MPAVNDVAGFPCFEVQFTKSGALIDDDELDRADAFVADRGITDLFVISHGWNNDMREARELYAKFLGKVRDVRAAGHVAGLGGRTIGVLAVLWPSKKFAEQQFIPSGAAGTAPEVTDALVIAHLDSLKGVFDDPRADETLEEAKALVPQLKDRATARREFANKIRAALPKPDADPGEAAHAFVAKDGDTILMLLKDPIVVLPPKGAKHGAAAGLLDDALRGAGNAVGGALRSVGGVLIDAGRSINDAAERFLNYATYYQMKERAGAIGQGGVFQILTHLRTKAPGILLHLIGHSFGGRLMTAAALGPEGAAPIKPETMTLLQAAFSHNAFAKSYDGRNDGFFRRVLENEQLGGPVLITHTANDQAVGIAYAYASRISGDTGAAVGDANDAFGGIGRNGAQHMKPQTEAIFLDLAPVGKHYTLVPGVLHNLRADVIADHGDICKEEVAYVLLTAVAMTFRPAPSDETLAPAAVANESLHKRMLEVTVGKTGESHGEFGEKENSPGKLDVVTLVLDMEPNDFLRLQENFLADMCRLLEIDISEARIISVEAGCVRVRLVLPARAVARLRQLVRRKDWLEGDANDFANVKYKVKSSTGVPYSEFEVIGRMVGRELTWLHLSDSHFQSSEGRDFSGQSHVQGSFLDQLPDLLDEEDLEPDLVLFSGDVAQSGSEVEYDVSYEFLGRLREKLPHANVPIIMVPGNHDVDRAMINQYSQDEADVEKFLADNLKVIEFFDAHDHAEQRNKIFKRLEAFNKFVVRCQAFGQPQFNHGYFFTTTFDFEGAQVGIAGLNSAWRCKGKGDLDRHKLLLGPSQLDLAAKELSNAHIKILIVHHPVESDWFYHDDIMYQRNKLGQNNFDFIVRGHEHDPVVQVSGFYQGEKYCHIGAGALYTADRYPIGFNAVRLNLDFGTGRIFFWRFSTRTFNWFKDLEVYRTGSHQFDMPNALANRLASTRHGKAPNGKRKRSIKAQRNTTARRRL